MSAADFNKYVNLTDHYALRGNAVTDFARSFGKFEGSGDSDLASLFAEKITAIYAGQIRMPVSEAWSKLPKISTLVAAAEEGFRLSESPAAPGAIDAFEKSLRQVFEHAVPAVRELSINATVNSDTLQSLTGNLMALRDEAVEALKVNGDGIFAALTRRITERKITDLHNSYLNTAPDDAIAGALSFTARELCHAARSEGTTQSSQLDEIEVLAGLIQRKAPTNAHATLSRLNDIASFLDEQNTSRYKAA
jgi:hypothetical protein